MLNLVAEK